MKSGKIKHLVMCRGEYGKRTWAGWRLAAGRLNSSKTGERRKHDRICYSRAIVLNHRRLYRRGDSRDLRGAGD